MDHGVYMFILTIAYMDVSTPASTRFF